MTSFPRFTARRAGPDEYEAALSVWMSVFDKPASTFEGVWNATLPERRATLVVDGDEGIAASVQVYATEIRDEEGNPILIGGIANVSTRPEYRGKGLSSSLLELSIEAMTELGCVWSYLFTGIDGFYAQFGWSKVAYQTLVAPVPSGVACTQKPRKVTRNDLSEMAAQYAAAHTKSPLSLIRTKADWTEKLFPRIEDAEVMFVPGGYGIISRSEEGAELVDFGAISEEAVENLLKEFVGWAGSVGAKSVKLAVPLDGLMEAAASALLPDYQWVSEFNGMIRSLEPAWDRERIEKLFARHNSRLAGPDGF